MSRVTRAVLLALLCCACHSTASSQTQSEAEKKLTNTAKEFRLEIWKLIELQERYEKSKQAAPAKESEIKKKHKENAKNSLNNFLIPSYRRFSNAYNALSKTLGDDNQDEGAQAIKTHVEGIEEAFDQMSKRIKNDSVTDGVADAKRIDSLLNNIIKSNGVPPQNPTQEPKSPNPPAPPAEAKPAGGDSWSLFHYLLVFVPFLLSIALTVAGVWWLSEQLKELNGRVTRIDQSLRRNLEDVNQNIRKLEVLTGENKIGLEGLQNRTLPSLEANFRSSLARVEAFQQQGRARESVIDSYGSALPIASYAPQQTTVAEYLTRASADSVKAKKVWMRADVLQEAPDGDAIYLLSPDERDHGMFKAIPNHPRFGSSQDYSHYAPFYDCDQPASGEVWIIEPALARYETESNQWRLHKKGKLQIS